MSSTACLNLTKECDCTILNVANGAVAQLGERVNRTDEVRGSNPLSSTDGKRKSRLYTAKGCEQE
jgi:hypothetical protein